MNKEYLSNIRRLLDQLENTQEQVIEQVAEACAECILTAVCSISLAPATLI